MKILSHLSALRAQPIESILHKEMTDYNQPVHNFTGCGGLVQNHSEGKMVISPSPDTEKLFYCAWRIVAPDSHNKITVNLEHLQLPHKGEENCK